MLKNYWKITIRNLLKNKVYALINILGLAIGLAGFIIISTYIKNELSFDRFHKNANRIYRPVEIQHHPGVGTQHVAVTMGPLAPALANDFPEILSAARIRPHGNFLLSYGDKRFYEEAAAADPAIFEIFTIPFSSGDPATALAAPNSMVLTRTLAEKYFGDANPLGEMISYGPYECQVTGVIDDYPENSHLHFEMLLSFSTIENEYSWLNSWHSNSMATYILLREGASAQALEAKFPEFLNKYIEEEKLTFELYLQPLLDVHLRSDHIIYQTYNYHRGDIQSVYIFSLIALFILLIACINFMNLATARSARRAKEVGVRKVLGSQRKDLVLQFLGESILITGFALLLGLLIVQVVMPFFKEMLGDRFIFDYYENRGFILELVALTLLVGIVAGSYPAFYLSRFRPVETLKSTTAGSRAGQGGASLRKVLVVLQFAIAIVLLVCTGVVIEQLDYVRNRDLGYNKDQIVYIPLRGKEVRQQVELLKEDLQRQAGIRGVTASSGLRGASGSQGTMTVAGTSQEVKMMMRYAHVDFDFIKTMEMRIMEGRDFSPAFAEDSVTSVIINQAAVKEFGWENPIGKEFEGWGDEAPNFRVIGVVNDYHFYSLRQKIEPLIMFIDPPRYYYLLVKLQGGDIPAALEKVEQVWKTHLPDYPYEYDFLDAHFNGIYKTDLNTGKLFGIFASLAIFIACLGLFGLAAFTAEQKTKEIGIRKVLGASIPGLIALLSKDFIKPVLLANLIAWPLAYWGMRNWLAGFVYHTEMGILVFVAAALLALLIALLTIIYQALKVALANPVKSLRYE
ncbi:MAG: ABC transporter permease [Calditrichaeota bacterium]|nr:ABC transporter permease [Calditrichota bacterium]